MGRAIAESIFLGWVRPCYLVLLYYVEAIAKVKVTGLLGFLRKKEWFEGRSRSVAKSGLNCLKSLLGNSFTWS
ncbi:MAG: hypothetical protein EA367_08130 [Leptolyngbya sp. DLM2.Bin15]|nr:MAG: hypothetical protein EA367_08130 [Leptolyngbya sp. DLM2.Bin15]